MLAPQGPRHGNLLAQSKANGGVLMLIRHFIPLAVLVIALLCVAATKAGVPAPPIGIIATVAAVLLALQLEDRKLGDLLGEFLKAFKHEPHA
jgi:hypothetical protein